MFTFKGKQSPYIQRRNRDMNNYFYENKKNFIRLIKQEIF